MADGSGTVIGRGSAVQVSMVVALIAGAYWIWNTTTDVKNEILPQMAEMRANVQNMARAVDKMAGRIDTLPTLQGVRSIVLDEMKDYEARFGDRIRSVEDRIRNIEDRVGK